MVLPAARTSHFKMTSANGSQQLDKNLEGAQPTVPVLKSSSPTSSQLAITPDNKNWDGGRIPHWQPPGVSADRDREMRCMRILHMAIAARRSIVPKFLVPLLKCIGPRRVSHFHSCLSKVEKCQVVRWLAK
ncbi:hypothetical protein V9T40_006148 [Parthenolecanium corni]|uniref:Uncharacterized protein n=1 Tax=Parthenolecanium corni TaxID=536013 RepID=A0AAN9TW92_9HEMI